MTDEAIEPEVEVELDEEAVAGTWIGDNELHIFDSPVSIGGYEVFCAMACAGDVLLGLVSDMKMHKLEIVKGMPDLKPARAKLGVVK